MRLLAIPFLAAGFGLFLACSGDDGGVTTTATSPDAGTPGTPPPATGDAPDAAPVPAACPRLPKPDDHLRKVVISHPFAEEAGKKATRFEVLELSAAGQLAKTGETFEMHAAFAEIVFTPDGKVGLVAQDDGTIGVFTFDDVGKVKVVHDGFKGAFSAGHLVMSKDGGHVFVLDPNTADNGGGVHRMVIRCDGSLSDEGLVVPGGTAHAMTLLPNDPDRALLVGGKAFDSPEPTYAHRLDFSTTPPKRVASGPVFEDKDAIASSVAVTLDGKYALVTENGYLKGSRMAPVALADMTSRATIATPNPAGVVMSPFGNALLLMNSDGEDALRVVRYDPANDAAPFTITGEIETKGGKTELPILAGVVGRGALKGRVLVAEVSAVRQLSFAADGTISDLDAKVTFEGMTGIVGSLGVEP